MVFKNLVKLDTIITQIMAFSLKNRLSLPWLRIWTQNSN